MTAHWQDVGQLSRGIGRAPIGSVDFATVVEPKLREYARRHEQGLRNCKHLFAGGIAGCVAKTAVAPLSRVTILMQVQTMRPQKFSDGVNPNNLHLTTSLRKILQEEGIVALWRGNFATILHRFPYTSVTFYGNGVMRRWLNKGHAATLVPEQARGLIAGGGSASIGVLLCYPLDVVKTRLMTQTKREYYSGITDALGKIGRDEGIRGYYRGLSVSLMSVVPALALNFALYEEFFRLFSGVGMPTPLHALLAGGSSGAIASTLLFPADLLRRQMQMVGLGGRPQVYSSVFQAGCHVFSTGCRRYPGQSTLIGPLLGIREFFRGLFPELLKVTPNNAIMFAVHSQLLRNRWPYESCDTI